MATHLDYCLKPCLCRKKVSARRLFQQHIFWRCRSAFSCLLLILADINRFPAPVLTLELVQPALTVLSDPALQPEGAAPQVCDRLPGGQGAAGQHTGGAPLLPAAVRCQCPGGEPCTGCTGIGAEGCASCIAWSNIQAWHASWRWWLPAFQGFSCTTPVTVVVVVTQGPVLCQRG